MKTAITYGTFDMFHIGHLRLIQRIREISDRLIVAVSTDEFNEKKNKECIIPFRDRAEIVKSIVGVDLVIPESCWEQKRSDIKEHDVDIFVMGDDWQGKFDNLNDVCKVIYLSRTVGISTTNLKQTLVMSPQQKEELLRSLNLLDSIKKNLM
jgi:glycerol-3-phosphate cytidylyltransferase